MLKKIIVNNKNTKYNIIIGKKIFPNLSKLIGVNNKVFKYIFIIDSKVYKKHKKYIIKNIKKLNPKIILFDSKESSKNLNGFLNLSNKIFQKKPDRNSKIIVIGGGVLGDLGGFIASTTLRGLDLILIPTTLLSQVDSSVGGKNGINNFFGKNMIGTFYNPKLVIIDTYFLNTLSKKEILSGYSEIFKHSLIKNKKFFYWLDKNFNEIISLKEPLLTKAIYQSIKIKLSIVLKDEKEKLSHSSNSRAILNLGHTVGHALEGINRYKSNLTHGEAIAVGIVCAIRISNLDNLISINKVNLIIQHMKKVGLPIKNSKIKSEKIFEFILRDKKNKQSKIKYILLKDIGRAFVSNNISLGEFKKKFKLINDY